MPIPVSCSTGAVHLVEVHQRGQQPPHGSVPVRVDTTAPPAARLAQLHLRALADKRRRCPSGGDRVLDSRPLPRGRLRPVSPAQPHLRRRPQTVAVAPDGRMALAWADWTNRRVEARVRSSTGVLGRPFLLTRDLGVNAQITALAAGLGAVGWIDRDPARARPRRARHQGPPLRPAPTRRPCGRLRPRPGVDRDAHQPRRRPQPTGASREADPLATGAARALSRARNRPDTVSVSS